MEEGWKQEVLSKLIDSVPTLLILLGTVLLILGLAGGVTFHQWLPISGLWVRACAGTAGAIIFALGLVNWRTRVILPKAKNYGITIDYPRDGDLVDIVDVRGRIKKTLPEDYALRVLRIYSDNRIAPAGECRVDPETGTTWEAKRCAFGSGAAGEEREFGVYLVGPSGTAFLNHFSQAARVHKRVIDKLRKLDGRDRLQEIAGTDGEFLPAIEKPTPDMIPGPRVRVRKQG